MAAMAATLLDPDFSGSQIDLVIKDEDVFWLDFIKTGDFDRGKAGFVHEALWFCQNDFAGSQTPIGNQRAGFGFPIRKAMLPGQPVNRHKSGIMPVFGIIRSGVSKAYE
jgi:hypothetical protein